MAINLNPIGNPEKVGGFNNNFQIIEDELNDNVLRRDGLSPGEANHMEVNLDMNGNAILNVSTDTDDEGSLLNLGTADLRYVGKAGDTMSGVLSMGGNSVTNLPAPTQANEATRKSYVDSGDSQQVSKTGDSMSGNLDMSGNDITGTRTTVTDNLILGGLPVNAGPLQPNTVIYVDTIADLQALPTSGLVDGQQVHVKGSVFAFRSGAWAPISDINILATGALPGVDSTVSVQDAVEYAALHGVGVYVPASSQPFLVDRITLDAVDGLSIYGPGELKKIDGADSGGIFILTGCSNVAIGNGLTLDGNRANVFVNLYSSDLVWMRDCVDCTVEKSTLRDSISLGVSVFNSSSRCNVIDNTFDNCRFAGVQIHAGYRDHVTGAYLGNAMPQNCTVRDNHVVGCGEGIRCSGTIGSKVIRNTIKDLDASSGLGHGIFIFTATHPNEDLALGTQDALIEGNTLDTALAAGDTSGYIVVLQGQNADETGSAMENIVIRKNRIVFRTPTTGVNLRSLPNHVIRSVTVEVNIFDSRELTGTDRPTGILTYRLVADIDVLGKNTFLGSFSRCVYVIGDGLPISGVRVNGLVAEATVSHAVYFPANVGGSFDNVYVEDITVNDVATSGANTYAIYLHTGNNIKVRGNKLSGVTNANAGGVYLRNVGGTAYIENNDVSGIQNKAYRINDFDGDNYMFGNLGYISESSGKATIPAGSNVINNISHGMDLTPRNIEITPTGDYAPATRIFVSAITGSLFTINTDADLTNSVEFWWRVKR